MTQLEPTAQTGWITLARIAKARGIRGEVAADAFTSGAERFRELQDARLFGPDPAAPGIAVHVENAWLHDGRVILKFTGIDSVSEAEKLAGMELRVPASERPPAPDGAYYQADLIGCALVEADGSLVGTVTRFESFGGPDLLVVDSAGGEILVPFAKSICVEINPAERKIVAHLPEGLKELGK